MIDNIFTVSYLTYDLLARGFLHSVYVLLLVDVLLEALVTIVSFLLFSLFNRHLLSNLLPSR